MFFVNDLDPGKINQSENFGSINVSGMAAITGISSPGPQ
jgi:hypothetical protein